MAYTYKGRPAYTTPSHLSAAAEAPVTGVANNPNWGLSGTGRNRSVQNAIAAAHPTSSYAGRIGAYNAHDAASAGGDTGLSAAELAQMTLNAASGGGGGGGGGGGRSGGGGGGGGYAPPSAEVQAAYQALLANFTGDAPDPWASYDDAMRKAYGAAPVNQRWDETGRAVTGASKAGSDRLAGIMQELTERALQSRTDVNQSVQRGADALTGLQSQFNAQAAQQNRGLNQGLGAFGAGRLAPTGQDSLNNLFAAGQVQNRAMGNAYDVMAGDRDAVYAGLGADVAQGMTRDQAALQAAIANQRSRELSSNSTALAQALGQSGVQRAQAEIDRQMQADKLRLEMAQLGITI